MHLVVYSHTSLETIIILPISLIIMLPLFDFIELPGADCKFLQLLLLSDSDTDTNSPTPLSLLQPNTNQTPPPNMPAMKIMRRVGQPAEKGSASGSTAPSSCAPSKATSEAGLETSDGASSAAATPARDRVTMSREEREAKYQEARERIFRDFPESKSSDSPKSGEQSANISRSSSKAGRKKGPRQKTPHDDGFEARSQFNAYYYGGPYTQMPYNNMVNDGSFVAPTYAIGPGAAANFAPAPVNAMYSTHANMNTVPQYQMGSPTLSNQTTWQGGNMQPAGYPATQLHPMMPQQNTPRQPTNLNTYNPYPQPSQSWGQAQYQSSYQIPGGQRNLAQHWPVVSPHNGQIPYNYGQSPHQNFAQVATGNSVQHPSQASFTRAPFNPQSRSFAPSANPSQRHAENGIAPVWKENTSNAPRNTAIPQPTMRNNNYPPFNPPNVQAKSTENRDSIAKWGTPAHLPPKPPPSEVPYKFDVMGRASASTATTKTYSSASTTVQSTAGPLVVSGVTGRQKAQLQGGMSTGL